MPSPLENRLAANGCDMPIDAFKDRLVVLQEQMFSDWSVDELLLHPHEGIEYCISVRRDMGYYNLPDDLILRLLLDKRKHP